MKSTDSMNTVDWKSGYWRNYSLLDQKISTIALTPRPAHGRHFCASVQLHSFSDSAARFAFLRCVSREHNLVHHMQTPRLNLCARSRELYHAHPHEGQTKNLRQVKRRERRSVTVWTIFFLA